MNIEKFKGVFPAFYACYDEEGEISAERTQALAEHLLKRKTDSYCSCSM